MSRKKKEEKEKKEPAIYFRYVVLIKSPSWTNRYHENNQQNGNLILLIRNLQMAQRPAPPTTKPTF